KISLIFLFLTILTQTGGLIYLLYKPIGFEIKKYFRKSLLIRISVFIMMYGITTFTVIPLAARQFNRVPMPISETNRIKPGSFLTWSANTHYVDPKLKYLLFETADQLP